MKNAIGFWAQDSTQSQKKKHVGGCVSANHGYTMEISLFHAYRINISTIHTEVEGILVLQHLCK